MTSRDYEVATTSLGKWYTGGRGFSLPAIGHGEVLVEEEANSTDQGGVLHQAGKWYTGGRGFSLPAADQKVLTGEKIRSTTEQKAILIKYSWDY